MFGDIECPSLDFFSIRISACSQSRMDLITFSADCEVNFGSLMAVGRIERNLESATVRSRVFSEKIAKQIGAKYKAKLSSSEELSTALISICFREGITIFHFGNEKLVLIDTAIPH